MILSTRVEILGISFEWSVSVGHLEPGSACYGNCEAWAPCVVKLLWVPQFITLSPLHLLSSMSPLSSPASSQIHVLCFFNDYCDICCIHVYMCGFTACCVCFVLLICIFTGFSVATMASRIMVRGRQEGSLGHHDSVAGAGADFESLTSSSLF